MIISIISIILLIILSIILLLLYKKEKKKLKKEFIENCQVLFEQELEKNKQQIEERVEEYKRDALKRCEQWREAQITERQRVDKSLEERKQAVEEIIEQLENRRREAEKLRDVAVADGKEKIDLELNGYKKLRLEQANNDIEKEIVEKRSLTLKEFGEFTELIENQKAEYQEELQSIIEQLNDYKKKQAAINEEILRQRRLEEQQDFYRVILTEEATEDIQTLLVAKEKLNYREILDKIIYDGYIAKPVNEMIKRVLEGRAPSGIYKITRLKTGEVYIGKSTDIKKRWSEHTKTAYGVGSIAHSTLHTIIRRDGIGGFTFELLEEVPKDKLTEREKYWITFYGSKEYGLNERNG